MKNNYNEKPAWESDSYGRVKDYLYWNSNKNQMVNGSKLGGHIDFCYHAGELTYSNMMDWKTPGGKQINFLKGIKYM